MATERHVNGKFTFLFFSSDLSLSVHICSDRHIFENKSGIPITPYNEHMSDASKSPNARRSFDLKVTYQLPWVRGFTYKVSGVSHVSIGQFQKISIPNHGQLPCFNPTPPPCLWKFQNALPPLPPPCPQNSIIVKPPTLWNSAFFWKYIFDLATPI